MARAPLPLRHSHEGGNPVTLSLEEQGRWIPAFAGMTSKKASAR
jgi:hypothetical protein